MKLTVITPEKVVFQSIAVEEVIVPGIKGELGILKGHAPLITTLSSGVLKYSLKDLESFEKIAISWGYCEIRANQEIVVLAESAETQKRIDKDTAEKELAKILKRLEDISLTPEEIRKLRKEEAEIKTFLQLYQ